jgi:hypothetical protein
VAKPKEPFNPFYALVIGLGVVFAVTTFAYGTMAYRAVAHTDEGPGLMELLDRHGVSILSAELGLLGVATFGAMSLDGMRTRRNERDKLATAEDKESDR